MVKGLKSLRRKLKKIPKATKGRLQADILSLARNLNVDQRSLAPRDDGSLIASIRSQALGGDRIGAFVRAGGSETTRPVREGVSISYDYALAQEFGTEDMPPNPFFYFPYRQQKRSIKGKITRGITKAVKTVV